MAKKDVENSLSRRAKRMVIPCQYANTDFGKKTRTGIRKVVVRDTATGEVYGSRAIATKESVSQLSFKQFLIERSDMTELPKLVIDEIQKNIRDGAKDVTQEWKTALELVTRAYAVTHVRIPTPDAKGAWRQYEDLITYAVRQLHTTRGRDGKWRLTDAMVKEGFDDKGIEGKSHRFFVTVPGEEACEIDADSMDDIIDQLTAKLYRNGARARVLKRDDTNAEIGVFVDGIKQEHIVIRTVS